jgi:hypothetical protein
VWLPRAAEAKGQQNEYLTQKNLIFCAQYWRKFKNDLQAVV